MTSAAYLSPPEPTPAVERFYRSDVDGLGYVMNLSRLWAHQPDVHDVLFAQADRAVADAGLSFRQRAVLVVAAASAFGDAYCALAWGNKLADVVGTDAAAGVIRGREEGLDATERALARWARRVARDPGGSGPQDVQELRDVGYDDGQIFAVTVFVAIRIAFATVNDALGALPDRELHDAATPAVRDAVADLGSAVVH